MHFCSGVDKQERENKLMNARAIIAALAHEVKQPLAATAANASAAIRFLGRAPPDLVEARSALNRIREDSHRTNDVFDGIRALFGKVDQGSIDVNKIIVEVMQTLRNELKDHWIEACTELMAELPPVSAHKGQLREVIFNLVTNALEAMAAVTDRNRVLWVKSQLRGHDAIVVSVQDTGPGIDPKRLDKMFDAFVTTKSQGTGLGLAICRLIIEHHGGQLSASSDGKSGALFQFVLPIAPADKDIARTN